jgi:hypothetical protein
MPIDQSFIQQNRLSTGRIREMARHSIEQMLRPVGEHWTVSIVLAHLAFWDRRVLNVVDMTQRDGRLSVPQIDILVNDLSLPLWAAIPPSEAARLAIEAAEALDKRLEDYPPGLLEEIYNFNPRWVIRALHRNEHLDEAAAALQ